jgi:hypothetical protein
MARKTILKNNKIKNKADYLDSELMEACCRIFMFARMLRALGVCGGIKINDIWEIAII